jgi:hypothetical protein
MPHSTVSTTEGQQDVGTAETAGAGQEGNGTAAPGQAGPGSVRPADDDRGQRTWGGRDPGSLLWNP